MAGSQVREKVERILRDWLGSIQIDREGRFTIRHESAQVFIDVIEMGDSTIVNVVAPTNFDVPPSAELFKHVALHADDYTFGHLGLQEAGDGKLLVTLRNTILGDFLDPEELKVAVRAVASTADGVDDEIRDQFGGTVFHDGQ